MQNKRIIQFFKINFIKIINPKIRVLIKEFFKIYQQKEREVYKEYYDIKRTISHSHNRVLNQIIDKYVFSEKKENKIKYAIEKYQESLNRIEYEKKYKLNSIKKQIVKQIRNEYYKIIKELNK